MSEDIVNFLRARYAEERGEANKRPDETKYEMDPWEIRADGEVNYPCTEFLRIAKARVLAEVETKEQILRELPTGEWHEPCASLVSLIVAYLSLPYADHPDYQQEWRP